MQHYTLYMSYSKQLLNTLPYTINVEETLLTQADASLQQLTELTTSPLVASMVTPAGLTLQTTPAGLPALALLLRNHTLSQFSTLTDIAAVDKLHAQGRFVLTYHFLSTHTNQRLTVQTFSTETSIIPSLAAPFVNGQRIFAAAN